MNDDPQKMPSASFGDAHPWARRISEGLGLADQAHRMTGRDAFALDHPDLVCLVLRGTLNVFLVEPNGHRHSFAQVGAGEVAFGVPAPDGGSTVVAVPGAGTEVVGTDRDAVTAAMGRGDEAFGEALGSAIECWLGRLFKATLVEAPPGNYQVLHPGDHAGPFGDDHVIVSGDDMVWVRVRDGAMSYLSATDASSGLWPLDDGAWIDPAAGSSVDGISTADFLKGAWANDLERVHGVLLARFGNGLAENRKVDWQRLGDRRSADTLALDGSIGTLAGVVSGSEGLTVAAPTMPLLSAAYMVAEAAEISIDLPKGGLKAIGRSSDPLSMLAEVAGFHTIPVHLEGDWWRRDQGPLLAFVGTDRNPVALLPTAPGAYEAADPVTMRRWKVTAQAAKEFARDARSFIHLLPSRAVSFRDVWKNGMHGLGADFGRLAVAMVLAGSVAFSMPLIIEQIIGTAVPEADRGELAVLVGMMVAVALAGAGFSIVQSLALLRIEGRASSRTQLAVFARMLRLPTEFFRNFTAGDLSVRVRGVEEMRQLLSDNMLFIIMATVNGTFSLVLMLYYEVTLGLTVAAIAVVVGLLNYYFGGRVVQLQRALLNIRGDVEADVVQYLAGITELRTNNAERQAFSRWSAKFSAGQKHAYDVGLLSNAGQTTNAVFSFASVLAIVIAIGLISDQLFAFINVDLSWESVSGEGLEGSINPAQFMAFYAAFGQFSLAVNQVVQSGLNLTALAPAYDRLRPLLETEEEYEEGEHDPGVLRGEIDVTDVQFRYVSGQPLVLKGVSLSAKAGQFVAVVGPSGAGKSSLMRLLLGFDNPEAGSVFLDGQDLRHLNKRSVRRNFGVVLQTVRVMTGTILENITNGTDMSEEDAWWAAEQVGFADDIRRMPDGLYTMLSDGGSTLSGGQCQRLMLARAIIRRPRIMLLDEATSALDNEVQSIVTGALDKLNCTRIVIAHRLSTIANADLIYVIDAGHVVEHGTYSELMALEGVFYDLAKRQLTE